MTPTQQIETRIRAIVAELNELVRQQALQAVNDALGSSGGLARRGPGRPRATHGAAAEAPAAARGPRARARKKGEKRTAAELAALERALADHVRGNPGQGIEAIGKALSLPTSELTRPMKKLVERGDIRTQGEKRATKYFGGDGSSAGSSEPGEGGGASAGRKRAARRSGGAKKRSKKKS